nr:hypothetical protein [Pseudooceanicola marinus]
MSYSVARIQVTTGGSRVGNERPRGVLHLVLGRRLDADTRVADRHAADLVAGHGGHDQVVGIGVQLRPFGHAGLLQDGRVVVENRRGGVEGHDVILAVEHAYLAGEVEQIVLQRFVLDIVGQIHQHATVGGEAIARHLHDHRVGFAGCRDRSLQLGPDVVVVADVLGIDGDTGVLGLEGVDDLVQRLARAIREAVPEFHRDIRQHHLCRTRGVQHLLHQIRPPFLPRSSIPAAGQDVICVIMASCARISAPPTHCPDPAFSSEEPAPWPSTNP